MTPISYANTLWLLHIPTEFKPNQVNKFLSLSVNIQNFWGQYTSYMTYMFDHTFNKYKEK